METLASLCDSNDDGCVQIPPSLPASAEFCGSCRWVTEASDLADVSTTAADSDACSVQLASELLDASDNLRATKPNAGSRLSRKRAISSDSDTSVLVDPSMKSRLHDVCTSLLNRQLQPGDIRYEVQEIQCDRSSFHNGSIARLRLPTLPGMGEQVWTSGPSSSRKEARLKAVASALKALAPNEVEQLHYDQSAASQVGASLEIGGGANIENDLSSKSKLANFLQWKCGRPLRKGDIVYSTSRESGQYYTTIVLNCFKDLRYVGGPANDAKQAQDLAASNVLAAFRDDVKRMEKMTQGHKKGLEILNQKKRRLCSEKESPIPPTIETGIKLHDACSALLNREIEPGDITYDMLHSDSGFVAKLKLPCMLSVSDADDLGHRVWATPVPCASKRDARANVAMVAVRDMVQQFPSLAA